MNRDPVVEADPPDIQGLNLVQARTLILTGQLDLPDFRVMSKELSEKIPDAQKVELADVGHVSMMEAPEKFNEIVMSFLEN